MTSKSIPEPIRLVQEFVNTYDVEGDEEELSTPDALRAWFGQRGLIDANALVNEDEWSGALELREALRALALGNNGIPPSDEVMATINSVAARYPLVTRFDPQGSASLVPARPGVEGAIGSVLGSVYNAMADGSWARMKACAKDSCRWVFYDLSKNHSGKWCSMAVCGNRVKAQHYRETRRSGATA